MLDSLISAFFVLALIGLVEVAKDIFRLLLGLFAFAIRLFKVVVAFAKRHFKVVVAFALTLLIFALVAIVVNTESPRMADRFGDVGDGSRERHARGGGQITDETRAGREKEAVDLDNSETEIDEGWEDLEWELPEPPDQSLDEPTTGENTETNAIPDASEDVSTNRAHRFLRLPRWGRKAAPAE